MHVGGRRSIRKETEETVPRKRILVNVVYSAQTLLTGSLDCHCSRHGSHGLVEVIAVYPLIKIVCSLCYFVTLSGHVSPHDYHSNYPFAVVPRIPLCSSGIKEGSSMGLPHTEYRPHVIRVPPA